MPTLSSRAPARLAQLVTRTLVTRALPLASALLLAACTPSRSSEPQLHLLLALADTPTTTLQTTIGVGPVRVAPFLDSGQLMVHDARGSVRLSSQHRWSEPLDQGIQRVTLQNLATLTQAKLRTFPWRQRAAPQLAIRVEVLDLGRLANGDATLDVIWHLENMTQERLTRSRRERFTAPADAGFEALPHAYSQLLLQFAQRLVAAIEADLSTTAPAAP